MKLDTSEKGESSINAKHVVKMNDEVNSDNGGDTVLCCENKSGLVDEKKKKTKFTCKQKLSLVMLALADFMSFCSMSILAPFYPAESSKKGMSESMAGLVFGYYALVVFLSSPVMGKVLPKFGAKNIFIMGLFLSGIADIVFGLIGDIEDYALFVALSFIIRSFVALGASAYATASYVLIINIFPDNAGGVRGILEIFVGLGLCAGPGIGGVLYTVSGLSLHIYCVVQKTRFFPPISYVGISICLQHLPKTIIAVIDALDKNREHLGTAISVKKVGGFGLPFYTVGIIVIFTAFLNVYLLAPTKRNNVEKSGSLINLLKLPPVLITCVVLTVTAMSSAYLDPTLEPHLRKFNLSPTHVGLLFLLESSTYGITCPVWGWVTDKTKDYTWLMTTGLFSTSVVLLFLGPSPIFTFLKDSLWLNAASLAVLGISIGMSLIPTYQYILDSSMENGFEDCLGTHSIIAGLWSSVYSLGEMLGPILAGTLMEHCGFPITSTTFAFLNFAAGVTAMIYFKTRDMATKVATKKSGVDNVVFCIESDNNTSLSTTVNSNCDNIVSIRL